MRRFVVKHEPGLKWRDLETQNGTRVRQARNQEFIDELFALILLDIVFSGGYLTAAC